MTRQPYPSCGHRAELGDCAHSMGRTHGITQHKAVPAHILIFSVIHLAIRMVEDSNQQAKSVW